MKDTQDYGKKCKIFFEKKKKNGKKDGKKDGKKNGTKKLKK